MQEHYPLTGFFAKILLMLHKILHQKIFHQWSHLKVFHNMDFHYIICPKCLLYFLGKDMKFVGFISTLLFWNFLSFVMIKECYYQHNWLYVSEERRKRPPRKMLNISGPNIGPFCTLRELAFNSKVSKLASSRTYIRLRKSL